MIDAELAPLVRYFASGTSPMSHPDLRIKKRYIFHEPAKPRDP